MGFETTREDEGHYRVTFDSGTTFGEILSAIEESESFVNPLCELWDISQIRFDFSSSQVQQFAERAKAKQSRPRRVAILVGDTLSFGVSRIYSGFSEQGDTEIGVFKSELEASYWLERPMG